jgi:hypothetical protein
MLVVAGLIPRRLLETLKKCPVAPESIIIGGEGVDIVELIIWLIVISLVRMCCRPSGSLLPSLKTRDKVVGVASRVQGGCVCLVVISWVVARCARVITVGGVTMGPAVATRAFSSCRGGDG